MEQKVYFIDWSKTTTEVRAIKLNGESPFLRAYFIAPPQWNFDGKLDQQIDAIAMMIARYKPDLVISDLTGIGQTCTQALQERLKLIGYLKDNESL